MPVQVPVLQLWQAPSHARSQQIPSMQTPEAQSLPAVQLPPLLVVQVPPSQVEPAGQRLPQAPQLRGSVVGSTQSRPHSMAPGGQAQLRRPRASFGPQVPEQHWAFAVQVTPVSRQAVALEFSCLAAPKSMPANPAVKLVNTERRDRRPANARVKSSKIRPSIGISSLRSAACEG
jgi:hypothetical protein